MRPTSTNHTPPPVGRDLLRRENREFEAAIRDAFNRNLVHARRAVSKILRPVIQGPFLLSVVDNSFVFQAERENIQRFDAGLAALPPRAISRRFAFLQSALKSADRGQVIKVSAQAVAEEAAGCPIGL